MAAQTVTLAASGNSGGIDLSPSARITTFQLTVNSGSSGTSYVQVTLDEPLPAGQTVTWGNLSSAIASSGIDGLGQTYTLYSPVSGARLSAVTASSSGGPYTTTATLKVLQSIY